MVRETVYLQEATLNTKSNKENLLSTLFEKSYSEYEDADRRIVLYLHQLDLAGKAISILEIEYSASGGNFEEVLRMEKRMLKYALELEKARGDKQAAIGFIHYLMGK